MMTALTIPADLVGLYVSLGWILVSEGCCGLARVAPPLSLTQERRPRLWRVS
jgi:hypothetical protein